MKTKLTKDWYFLVKRSDVPILPVIHKLSILDSEHSEHLYGSRQPMLIIWDGSFASFYLHNEEFLRVQKFITSLFHSLQIDQHIEKMINYCQRAKNGAKKLAANHEKLTVEKFINAYEHVLDDYSKSFLYGFISWCPQEIQKEALDILKSRSKILSKLGLNEKTALSHLIRPPFETDFVKKEKILENHRRNHSKYLEGKEIDQETLKKKNRKLHSDIEQFLKEYSWVGYDYNGPEMSFDEVIELIKRPNEEKSERTIDKDILTKECSFTEKENGLFNILSKIAYVKDERNTCDDYVHFCLDKIYERISRQAGTTKTELKYLWPHEFKELLLGRKKFNIGYHRVKMSFSAFNSLDPDRRMFTGIVHREKILSIVEEKKNEETLVNKLTGMPACGGNVKGIVKIINNFNEISKMNDGDILVTHMTSPRFMPGIMKASGIITNEGGLTCHAAIIARELRKPCVIGTKIATKQLKDGDIVEMDASKGVIQIKR